MSDVLEDKRSALESDLAHRGSVLVALSGGVDSSVLLAAAVRSCGEQVLAVTGRSPSVPTDDLEAASRIARILDIEHQVVDTDELSHPSYASNPPDRCYHCKSVLFGTLNAVARSRGLATVVEGSNADDIDDYRPGMRAICELGVLSPLRDAGLTKAEVRQLARTYGLDVADRPSMACLASRFPYGSLITADGLRQVDRAERFLKQTYGLGQVRVRIHETMARIEVDADDMPAVLEARAAIHEKLQSLGFTWICLDLLGYRTGSLNEALTQADRAPDGPGGESP